MKNPHDATQPGINVNPFNFGQDKISSQQLIGMLASQMQAQNPTFAIAEIRPLSQNPDIMAVSYNYSANNINIVGLGVAIAQGSKGYWAEIYGTEQGLSGFNPPEVLMYVMQSMNSGTTPNTPQPSQQAQQPAAGQQQASKSDQQKMEDAAVGAHMWNMAPYIAPDVFTTMPLF